MRAGEKFRDYFNEQMKDEKLKKEYDEYVKTQEKKPVPVYFIRESREAAGISQRELSRRSGVIQADISKLERGIGNPSLKTIRRIADAMDADVLIYFRLRNNKIPAKNPV